MTILQWQWPQKNLRSLVPELVRMLQDSEQDDGILGFVDNADPSTALTFAEHLADTVQEGDKHLLIGTLDGRAVAMCVVSPSSLPTCRHTADVGKAFLDKTCRGAGLVTELVLQVCGRMEELGVDLLTIDVREGSHAQAVWSAFGFTVFGELDDYCRVDGISHRGFYMSHRVDLLRESASHKKQPSSKGSAMSAELLAKDVFRNKLEETLHSHLTISHPVFQILLDEKNPQPEFLQQVALQGYQLTKHFLEYIENIFFFCPAGKHRRRLLHNMYEEETGHISKTKNHVKLMQDFLSAIGIDDEMRESAVALPATQELIDYRMQAVKDPARYHVGAAAVTIASEGQNLETLGSDSRDALFEKVYGIDQKDLLFFSVHQVEDIGHTQQGLDLVSDICVTPEMQQEALYAVSHTCELFYQMYEGIYQEYLAGRLLPV